jgi:hypothetical protein
MKISIRMHPERDKEILDWLAQQPRGFKLAPLVRELLANYLQKREEITQGDAWSERAVRERLVKRGVIRTPNFDRRFPGDDFFVESQPESGSGGETK